MSESWVVQPETRRIPLSGEQWIVVKARLNAGEYRAHLRRGSVLAADGTRQVDGLELAVSRVVAYLVDWSADPPIRGVSDEHRRGALDAIDRERFAEVSAAIFEHETALEAESAKKKAAMTTGDDRILSSPSAPDGGSSGSAI